MNQSITYLLSIALMLILSFQVKIANAQELKPVSFEDVIHLQKESPKPMVVFLTAEWCTYCKRVEETSFKEEEVVNALNGDFYFILFDIEQKEPITLGDKTFKFNPTSLKSGVHELAETIGTIDGVLNTPTFILMNSKFEIIYRYGGFLDTEQIKTLLEKAS